MPLIWTALDQGIKGSQEESITIAFCMLLMCHIIIAEESQRKLIPVEKIRLGLAEINRGWRELKWG